VRASLDPAGVHQQMRPLDASAGGRVRLTAQPAMVRARRHRRRRRLAEPRIECVTGVIDADVVMPGKQTGRGKARLGRLLVTQVADDQCAQRVCGLRQPLPAGCRLNGHAHPGAQVAGQGRRAAFLPHCQGVGKTQRALRGRVAIDVPVEIGGGQNHRLSARRMHLPPGGDR